jgi:hypothetical protein
MRRMFRDQGGLFSYVSPASRVPSNHPLRQVRDLVRDVLKQLSHSLGRLYSSEGPPSVPPEQLLSALLLLDGAFYQTPSHSRRTAWLALSSAGVPSNTIRPWPIT